MPKSFACVKKFFIFCLTGPGEYDKIDFTKWVAGIVRFTEVMIDCRCFLMMIRPAEFIAVQLNKAKQQGWGYLAFSSPSAPQPCSFFSSPDGVLSSSPLCSVKICPNGRPIHSLRANTVDSSTLLSYTQGNAWHHYIWYITYFSKECLSEQPRC